MERRRALPDAAGKYDRHHVSIFDLQRLSPTLDAGACNPNGYDQGESGFSEQKKDRYPAVIVVHALLGYRDSNEGYAAAEFRKAGFATLTYDSFAARGTTGPALSASPAICFLAWRMPTPRCGGFRASPGSMPVELPFWVFPMVRKSPI
jgi:hypothetical protein